jgi:pyruvate dehydrogenase E1 component alpha subunit
MPKAPIYQAVTERLEILDKDGNLDESLAPSLTKDKLVGLYKTMLRMRQYDQKALKLQRQGRMGTWASCLGQEGAQAGLALAMEKADWIVPSFRENSLMLVRGVPGERIYRLWKGDEAAFSELPEGIECLPPAVPIASQMLHGVGIGMALKRRGLKAAAVTFAGDGASSQGDFHESLNFAGLFKPHTVFFIQNNQWAISVPFHKQTAVPSIAQKVHGYGVPGIQIDGNDCLAAYVASKEALDRARSGGGATLIEAFTYRRESHTTADEASRYRKPEEVAYWAERDPVSRMRKFLDARELWNDKKEEALLVELEKEIDVYVEKMEAWPDPQPGEIFDSMYKEMPWYLREEKEALLKEVGR